MHSKVKTKEKQDKGAEKEPPEKETELEELRDRLLRQAAEFDNYRKQLEREKHEFMKCSNEKLIIELLEVADNFERALPELKKKDGEACAGMEMIYRQLMRILEKSGVKTIDAMGHNFDPYLHEAFMQQESEKPDGTILEELQKGYMLRQKVIRHSKVKVSKQNNAN